jgi:hypothetical protein
MAGQFLPWFACEQPERPTNAAVMWHYEDCLGCDIKADMLSRLYPDDPHVAWLRDTVRSVDGVGFV